MRLHVEVAASVDTNAWPLLLTSTLLRIAFAYSPSSFPVLRVDPEHGGDTRCQVNEAAVVANFPITKQSGQQGEGMLRKRGVNERRLPFQGSRGATARLAVIVESRVNYLRK